MEALALIDEDKDLFLRNNITNGRKKLPADLYVRLADISDPYDPSKDYIGFVDPVHGVVIVDAESLTDFQETLSQNSSEQGTELQNKELNIPTSVADNDSSASIPCPSKTIDGHCSSKSHKTMHQLAYEKKMGRPLPNDSTRPISGFGIKKGKLLFNSSTFNAFEDEFHTDERTMGNVEMSKLQELISELNRCARQNLELQEVPSRFSFACLSIDEDDNLFLRSNVTDEKLELPSDLYDKLGEISDSYDSSKDYIGYVDPVQGVVIVDAETLDNEQDNISQDSEDVTSMTTATDPHASAPDTISIGGKSESGRGKRRRKKKTMHQMAYEKKNGNPLPTDNTRPISGFGIKKGELLFNSSTFNAFEDEYHTHDRAMGDIEKNKLQNLVNELNRIELESKKMQGNPKLSKTCVIL